MIRKLVYLATIALVAGGIAVAQDNTSSQSGNTATAPTRMSGHTDAQGDLPAAKGNESQSGKGSTVNPAEIRPGSKGAGETTDMGPATKSMNPGTGTGDKLRGTADTNASLPGAEQPGKAPTTAAPKSGTSMAMPKRAPGYTDAQGDLPGAKEGEGQSGKGPTANPSEARPGTEGAAVTPDQGRSPKGDLPGTVDSGQKGTTDTNGSLPGAEQPATK
jgi:hypothetical protein